MKTHSKDKLDFNYIIDGIYIGTNKCCQTHFDESLLKQGISVDISLEENQLDAPFGVEFYAWIPVKDNTAPTKDQFELGVSLLEKIVLLKKKVYVHCKYGHGRAPTLVVAYLIKQGKTVGEVIEFVKSKRPVVHLEDVQIRALEEFSNEYSNK